MAREEEEEIKEESAERKVEGPSCIKKHLRGSKRSFCGRIYDVGEIKGMCQGDLLLWRTGTSPLRPQK